MISKKEAHSAKTQGETTPSTREYVENKNEGPMTHKTEDAVKSTVSSESQADEAARNTKNGKHNNDSADGQEQEVRIHTNIADDNEDQPRKRMKRCSSRPMMSRIQMIRLKMGKETKSQADDSENKEKSAESQKTGNNPSDWCPICSCYHYRTEREVEKSSEDSSGNDTPKSPKTQESELLNSAVNLGASTFSQILPPFNKHHIRTPWNREYPLRLLKHSPLPQKRSSLSKP